MRELTYATARRPSCRHRKLLQAKRDDYYAIATANSGTTRNDSAVDIDGGIFTLSYYAKLGASLGDVHALRDGNAVSLSKDQSFRVAARAHADARRRALHQRVQFSVVGLVGESRARVAIRRARHHQARYRDGMAHTKMIADVVDAGILPPGALSVICGSSAGLLDQIQAFDVVSFTGSAQTAATLRAHPAFVERGARLNVEADSLNSAILCADATPDTPAFELFIKEVVREMTVKSGQKCTAIRRAFVPEAIVSKRRSKRSRQSSPKYRRQSAQRSRAAWVRCKPRAVRERAGRHRRVARGSGTRVRRLVCTACRCGRNDCGLCRAASFHGRRPESRDTCSRCRSIRSRGDLADIASRYDKRRPSRRFTPLNSRDAVMGSLVASVYSNDNAHLARIALELADTHGRVHAISPSVASRVKRAMATSCRCRCMVDRAAPGVVKNSAACVHWVSITGARPFRHRALRLTH